MIALPSSYGTLATILMASDGMLSTDAMVAQILTEEKSRRDFSTITALIAKVNNKLKGKKDAKKKKKCDHCKKKGHVKAECRKLKAEMEAKEKSKSSKLTAKIVTISDEPPLQLFMAELTAKHATASDKWIVDSGASAPMSSRRDWF